MLRYVYGDELHQFPKLRDTMFADRATQFRDRLGWAVTVTGGHERDQYDALNPLYVIWQRPDGAHGGSMRFLPTRGRTMINEHFSHLAGRIEHHHMWECTRFCLAEGAAAHVSAALMLGGVEVGLGFGLTHAVGVFDARMVRVYRALGWTPDVLGSAGEGREAVSLGRWTFSEAIRQKLCAKAGLSPDLSAQWFAGAFGLQTVFAEAG